MDEIARNLADGIEAALPGWVERSVARIYQAWSGRPPPSELASAAADAGRRARDEVGARVRALLSSDVDEQRSTPLAIARSAVRYPAEVLRAAGVPAVVRDEFAVRSFPDDDYDLSPATFADLDPALAEAGLAWGAAKAFEHKRRHSA
jgi:hypothetical protein